MAHPSGPVRQRQRRAWPPSARTLAALIATAALIPLVAACGGGGSSGSPGVANVASSSASRSSSQSSSAANDPVAYSRCIRRHGVPNFPDPASNGTLPKGSAPDFGVSDAQFQAAERACRRLLPNSDRTFAVSLAQCLETGNCPAALAERALAEGLKFARCMRSRGVPNWPDPTIDSIGRPSFQVTAAGISIDSTRSSQMLSKIGYCQTQPGAVLLRQE
jgi:hypothetical protein